LVFQETSSFIAVKAFVIAAIKDNGIENRLIGNFVFAGWVTKWEISKKGGNFSQGTVKK